MRRSFATSSGSPPWPRIWRACLFFVDAQIGRLLDVLDRGPHAANTIVVLWGDHGWDLGEKQHWGKWTGWSGPRAPLVIAPAAVSRDRFVETAAVCRRPVGLIDLYPTLRTPRPAAKNRVGRRIPDAAAPRSYRADASGSHHFRQGQLFRVRDDRWRRYRYADGSEELYDHERDPQEWTNLARDRRLDAVRERLGKGMPEGQGSTNK